MPGPKLQSQPILKLQLAAHHMKYPPTKPEHASALKSRRRWRLPAPLSVRKMLGRTEAPVVSFVLGSFHVSLLCTNKCKMPRLTSPKQKLVQERFTDKRLKKSVILNQFCARQGKMV